MARERMVTRTVEFTVGEVMCVHVEFASVEVYEYTVTGKHTEKELLKILKAEHETDVFKLVSIQSTHTEEKLFGMPEADFIRLADVLPPRNI